MERKTVGTHEKGEKRRGKEGKGDEVDVRVQVASNSTGQDELGQSVTGSCHAPPPLVRRLPPDELATLTSTLCPPFGSHHVRLRTNWLSTKRSVNVYCWRRHVE
jgi:hypothetical protein